MCWKEKIQWQSVTNGLRKEHMLRSPFLFLVFENILHKLYLIGVYEKVYNERGTVCSYKDADDLLKYVRSELYIDNVLSINNPNVDNWVPLIYPKKNLR
jgi:hypothetical protein